MKITIITDKTKDEEIIIRVHEKTELVEKIEKLVNETSDGFIGYKENEAMMLDINDVNCFITENNKVFAMTDEKLLIKESNLWDGNYKKFQSQSTISEDSNDSILQFEKELLSCQTWSTTDEQNVFSFSDDQYKIVFNVSCGNNTCGYFRFVVA